MPEKKPTPQPSARDLLRTKLLSSKSMQRQRIPVKLFGQDIEILTPTVARITAMGEDTDSKTNLVDLLLEFCYVPGTEDLVFEEGDRDVLNVAPFDSSMQRVVEVINTMLGLRPEEVLKNSEATTEPLPS